MRDRTIDVSRGLLVILMVYCHVMQFFGESMLFPMIYTLKEGINQLVFPCFVFCFGYTGVLAYLNKPYKRALPGMLKTALRSLFVFYLSGIAYRVVRENKPFAFSTVRDVMLLKDIPGWSEFLAAFALYAVLLIVGFKLFQLLADRPIVSLVVSLGCIACCFIPYASIGVVQLGLLIGGRQFSFFPIVQYMPYLLAGMVAVRGEKKVRLGIIAFAAVCSIAGVISMPLSGPLPARFPPSWEWILRPALGVAAIVLLSWGLCRLNRGRAGWIVNKVCDFFSHFGGKSLYYLLGSNLVLFTLAGKNIAPQFAKGGIFPWNLMIQTASGAFAWTAVLLCALWFVSLIAGRGGRPGGAKRAEESEKS